MRKKLSIFQEGGHYEMSVEKLMLGTKPEQLIDTTVAVVGYDATENYYDRFRAISHYDHDTFELHPYDLSREVIVGDQVTTDIAMSKFVMIIGSESTIVACQSQKLLQMGGMLNQTVVLVTIDQDKHQQAEVLNENNVVKINLGQFNYWLIKKTLQQFGVI
jgi:hypothetical protein